MQSFKITSVKNFMSHLLMKSTFDNFLLNEASVTTFNTFTIDGTIRKDFYSSEELAELPDTSYSFWSQIKPFCYEIIKGKKTPSAFRFILALDRTATATLVENSGVSLQPSDINGLFLNIKYEQGILTCVTGTSLKIFSLDKSLDQLFDTYIQNFFAANGIDFDIC